MSGPYRRLRAPKNATLEERLRLHMVEAPSGCWIWTGARSKSGYGRIQMNGRTGYAHRVSYEMFVGPIPDGLQLDHLCRRPACIKPLHLQAVTPQINTLRGSSPGARAVRTGKCRKGHELNGAYVRNGRRYCRICQKANHARYAQEISEAVATARDERMARLIAIRDWFAS